MIKRTLLIAAAAALSLASCRKDETLRSQDMGKVIGFSPYMERLQTKSQVTDVTAASLDTFRVMAYNHSDYSGYFASVQKATRQTSGIYGTYFTTGSTYYWPSTGTALDFFAWSGAGAGTLTNTSGVASIPYTVPAGGTTDFVVSSAVNCTKGSDTGSTGTCAQPLTFSHALTKVNSVTLKAKDDGVSNTANYKFIFTDIRIEDAKTTATYTFNPASPATNWGTPESATADYVFTAQSTGNFLGNATKTLKSSGDANDQFIILPQEATFSISYAVQYSADSSTWTEVMDTATKTVSVPMEMGKAYDITFQLSNDASAIIFSVSGVDAWTAAEYPEVHYVEGGTDYGAGIKIGDVTWAPVNCGVGADSTTTHGCGLLYQWGRMVGGGYNDGSQYTTETMQTATGATWTYGYNKTPEDSKFYYIYDPRNDTKDWYSEVASQFAQLSEWPMTAPSGTTGIGNPCPTGWRVPTMDELGALCYTDWDSSSHSGSIMRGAWNDTKRGWDFGDVSLPGAGCRGYQLGEAYYRGFTGYYWSSSVDGTYARILGLLDGYAGISYGYRASGYSVRCVEE